MRRALESEPFLRNASLPNAEGRTLLYTDISIGRSTLSFLLSVNMICSAQVEMVLAHIW